MDEEDTGQPSAVEFIRQLMASAREEGSELIELNVNPSMYRALVEECHPLSPLEVIGIPIREDASLDVPDQDGPTVH